MIDFEKTLSSPGAKRLVRLAYFDESGLFNKKQEPFVIVAGCIVHADNQLGKLEECLDIIREKHIPASERDGFVFHATNIFSGTKYFKNKEIWPWEKRSGILRDLASVPAGLGIPLIYGHVERSTAIAPPDHFDAADHEKALYCGALLGFELQLELTMRRHFKDEVTILIGEDNDQVRSVAKDVHNIYRSPKMIARYFPEENDVLPFTSIKEGCHFSPKDESPALQMADFTTFFIKKLLVKDKRAREFYDLMKPAFMVPPK